MSVQILLIDDHPLFVDGFVGMVRENRPDWSVESCYTATDGCTALRERPGWDLVIVDIQLPDADGFETIARMAELNAAVPRIIISGREDEAARFRARRAGASGFIIKSLATDAMLGVMDSVLAGGLGFADFGHDSPGQGSAVPTLSPRQIEVLLLLAEGHANKVIRHRLGIAERTVRSHLTELYQALGAHSRVHAILRAREMGVIE
jgi:DNA-binding NarL/FixJ family response regulator